MPEQSKLDIEALFLDHLNNAIETTRELPTGNVINKEASKRFGNGIKIVVHSNDHGSHFHIQHEGRELDARFSFPTIELINYKYQGGRPFTTLQIKNIITTCNIPPYRGFIETELDKQQLARQ
ncbi:hypothetical protein HJC99_03305 [Candidatus Saccharibacteria bacterium]|nr:hypothetical protein [Candidatus Saccharibacteria bacterium]